MLVKCRQLHYVTYASLCSWLITCTLPSLVNGPCISENTGETNVIVSWHLHWVQTASLFNFYRFLKLITLYWVENSRIYLAFILNCCTLFFYYCFPSVFCIVLSGDFFVIMMWEESFSLHLKMWWCTLVRDTKTNKRNAGKYI